MMNPSKWPRIRLAVGLGLVGGWLALWPAVPDAAGGAEESKQDRAGGRLPAPVVDTHHLMELFNQELYDLLRNEMQREPSGDEWWETIHSRGLRAAEVANLVAIRDRGGNDPRWMRLSAHVQQAGKELAEAAESQNLQRTQEAWRGLVESCNACHRTMAPEHAPQLEP